MEIGPRPLMHLLVQWPRVLFAVCPWYLVRIVVLLIYHSPRHIVCDFHCPFGHLFGHPFQHYRHDADMMRLFCDYFPQIYHLATVQHFSHHLLLLLLMSFYCHDFYCDFFGDSLAGLCCDFYFVVDLTENLNGSVSVDDFVCLLKKSDLDVKMIHGIDRHSIWTDVCVNHFAFQAVLIDFLHDLSDLTMTTMLMMMNDLNPYYYHYTSSYFGYPHLDHEIWNRAYLWIYFDFLISFLILTCRIRLKTITVDILNCQVSIHIATVWNVKESAVYRVKVSNLLSRLFKQILIYRFPIHILAQ